MARSRKGKEKDCNRESKKKKIDGNKDVDPQLWHAIAGTIVQIPQVNSNIFYFPQGHAEHACQPVNFSPDLKIPSFIPCRVVAIHYRADPDTDEVYAKLRLVPMQTSEVSFDDDAVGEIDDMSVTKNKYQSYTKTLTRSDVNKGSSGLSCPKNCAETFFPPLDYSDNLTSQDICPTDVHGETWNFKHVCRGAPKRHLLTTGWSDFVTVKRLVSGDSLVFLRAKNDDLHIGIRRSKRGNDFGLDPSSKSKPGNEIGIRLVPSHEELTSSSREKDDKPQKSDKGNELRISDKVMRIGKVKAEDVIEAVKLGVNMQPFDVVYYPGVGTPEFFVKTSLIRTTLQIKWCQGMKFKMAIETVDSTRLWLMGTIASVQASDPAWPDSLWRCLQVIWDAPDSITNTKRANPWQVEILPDKSPSNSFSPLLPQHLTFPMDGQFSVPTFPNNIQTPNVPIFPLPETSIAGMLGARHDHFSHTKSDFHLENIPFNSDATTSMTVPNNPTLQNKSTSKNDLYSIPISTQPSEKLDHAKPKEIFLFGKTIQIASGNKNAEKKITSSTSDCLQDLPKRSSGERLECNPESQCKKDTLTEETVENEDSSKNKK